MKKTKLAKLKNNILDRDVLISEELFNKIDALNQEHITHLGELSYAKLDYFHKNGTMLHISQNPQIDQSIEGFLIALPSNLRFAGHLYQSAHKYFKDFIFIERIIVSEEYSRLGIGSSLFLPIISSSDEYNLPVIMAINSDPPNELGLKFAINKLKFSPLEEEIIDKDLSVIYLQKTFSQEDFISILSFCRKGKCVGGLPKVPKLKIDKHHSNTDQTKENSEYNF